MTKNHVLEMHDTGTYKLDELSIEISNRCLLKCRHCSSGAGKQMKGELESETHFELMVQARNLGAMVLSLSGGDPILVPNIVDYVEEAIKLGYEQILLYTTGIWNTTGMVNGLCTYPQLNHLLEFVNKGLIFVFSLDSHDETTMDYIRGVPGAWLHVISAIRFLRSGNARVWAHFVPMVPNIYDLSKTRDLCCELGVEKLGVLRFVPQTRGLANKDQLLPDVHMFYKFLKALDIELSDPECKDLSCALRVGCPAEFRHAVKGSSVSGQGKVKVCHAGTDLVLVRPDGAVHPCAAWKSLPTDGNVKADSLKDIWENGAVFNAIRKYMRSGYKNLLGFCNEYCTNLESCRGGCPAQRLHAFGRSLEDLLYPESDPMCPTRVEYPRQLSS